MSARKLDSAAIKRQSESRYNILFFIIVQFCVWNMSRLLRICAEISQRLVPVSSTSSTASCQNNNKTKWKLLEIRIIGEMKFTSVSEKRQFAWRQNRPVTPGPAGGDWREHWCRCEMKTGVNEYLIMERQEPVFNHYIICSLTRHRETEKNPSDSLLLLLHHIYFTLWP